MNIRNRAFSGLFLILALIMIIQPASAATQSYLDPGYNYDIGYVASGAWQIYDLDITSTDDYDILALVYNHAYDFDLYVYDPSTRTYITSATAPYSTENGLDFIWAISTLKPGRYSVYVHSTSGAGNFAFFHFYNRQPIMRTVGTPSAPVTPAPAAQTPVVIQTQQPVPSIFSQVTHLSTYSIPVHTGAEAGNNAVRFGLNFDDANDEIVEWNGATIPVYIEIYTKAYDQQYNLVRGSLVYRGSFQISSWKEANPFMSTKIQIPFAAMQVPAGEKYGMAYITVTTPDGRTLSDIDSFTSLAP
jgi:hypothetical protein